MENLTIYDISRLSGVSITTVSRVLNGNENVNAETREKVEKVIREYGYVPKQKARNFGRNRTGSVGLLMDDVRHAYMNELAYTIIQELNARNIDTLIRNINDADRDFIQAVDHLIEKKVQGIILLGSIFEGKICRVSMERRYSEIPFVSVNANLALPNVYEVLQEQESGMERAVRYLYGQGRKHIAYVYRSRSSSDRHKLTGFQKSMERLSLHPSAMAEAPEASLTAGREATSEVLHTAPQTDAIIYSGDSLAVGGAHALHSLGIRIPEEIAIIGFNNSRLAGECYPPLTSIDNRIEESAKAAAGLMLEILRHEEPENILLPCGLVLRQSTEGTCDLRSRES